MQLSNNKAQQELPKIIKTNLQTTRISNDPTTKLLSPFTWTHIQLPQISKYTKKPPKQDINKKNKNDQHIKKGLSLEKQVQKIHQKKQRYSVNQHHYQKANLSLKPNNADKHTHKTISNDLPQQNKRAKIKLAKDRIFKSIQLQKQTQKNKTINRNFVATPNLNYLDYKRMKFKSMIDTSDPRKNHIKLNIGQTVTKSFIGSPPAYIKQSLIKIGWHNLDDKTTKDVPQLIWVPQDTLSHYTSLQPNQFLNHIQGSQHLTLKNLMHQYQTAMGFNSYPHSFALPTQSSWFITEYENSMVKSYLQKIANYIYKTKKNSTIAGQFNVQNNILKLSQTLQQMCLGHLLPLVLPNEDQITLNMISLCLYLQKYRKDRNYRYFEDMTFYKPIKVTINQKLSKNLMKSIVQSGKNEEDFIFLENIDQKILMLLIHYDLMLQKLDQTYDCYGTQNLWLVKPNFASQGKGILFFQQKDYLETLTNGYQKEESQSNMEIRIFKLKSKYNNKIIQKYIQKPFLIPQNKQLQKKKTVLSTFEGRKFDIRQWVLIVSRGKQPVVYRFDDAYLRFCSMKYDSESFQLQKHLTNYSISKNSTCKDLTLLLSTFLKHYPELSSHFYTQLDFLIINSLLNNPHLKYQEGCFQLFGYDVIMDQNNKLWLLQINSIPACQTTRDDNLKKISQKMVEEMMMIVSRSTNSKQQISEKNNSQDKIKHWVEIYPFINNKKNYQPVARSYQLKQIDSQISLIKNLKKKLHVSEILQLFYERIFLKSFFKRLKLVQKLEKNHIEDHIIEEKINQKNQININKVETNVQQINRQLNKQDKERNEFEVKKQLNKHNPENEVELTQEVKNGCCNQ